MKSKRVLTILLSMAIMLTFMPTLAFADVPETLPDATHNYVLDKAESTAPTCEKYGVSVYKCTGVNLNEDHLDCNAAVKKLASADHKWQEIQMTKEEYIQALVKAAKEHGEYISANDLKMIYQMFTGLCYVYVDECKVCGQIDFDFEEVFPHEAPSGTPACAESYNCKICGEKVNVAAPEDPEDPENPYGHTWGDWVKDGEKVCGAYTVESRKCKKCGKVETRQSYTQGYTEEDVEHTGLGTGSSTAPSAAEAGDYVQVGNKWYKYNTVLVEPTCTTPGTKALVCADCGQTWTAAIPVVDHDYEEISVPATCGERAYTFKVCKVCGKESSVKYSGEAPVHEYTVTKLADPTCYADGIVIVECAKCGRMITSDAAFNTANELGTFTVTTENDKLYYAGFNGELEGTKRIEIPSFAQLTHDFGKYENMSEPTCTSATAQAKKCSVCGDYNVHSIKEVGEALGHEEKTITVAPTCGSYGYSYKVCTRCNEELGEEFDIKQPVVALGTECEYAWKVLEEPTAFELGTRAKVCKVCGDELGATKESVAKKTIAAPAVKAGKKKATVTVKAVEGAAKYQIKVNGKVKKTVKKAGKYTIKKLKGGKKAKFQIVAINADGVKAASKTKSVKIKK